MLLILQNCFSETEFKFFNSVFEIYFIEHTNLIILNLLFQNLFFNSEIKTILKILESVDHNL